MHINWYSILFMNGVFFVNILWNTSNNVSDTAIGLYLSSSLFLIITDLNWYSKLTSYIWSGNSKSLLYAWVSLAINFLFYLHKNFRWFGLIPLGPQLLCGLSFLIICITSFFYFGKLGLLNIFREINFWQICFFRIGIIPWK